MEINTLLSHTTAPVTDTLLQNNRAKQQMMLAQITTKKRPILNAPGWKVVDGVSYNPIQSEVQAAEQQRNIGLYKKSVTGKDFGASGDLSISQNTYYGLMIMKLALPAVTADNVYLPRGWAYNSIQAIEFTAGSSNASNLKLDRHGIFQSLMMSAQTNEARNKLIEYGGNEVTKPQAVGTINYGHAVILLPWSTWNNVKKNAPISASDQPFKVNVYYANRNQIYSGAGEAGLPVSAFLSATVYFDTTDLIDKSLMINSRALMNNPGAMIPYPFIHRVSNTKEFLGDDTNSISLNLTGFMNADLTAISWMAIRKDELTNNATGTTKLAPFDSTDLRAMTLTRTGINIAQFDDTDGLTLFNTKDEVGGNYYVHSMRLDAASTHPFITYPKAGKVYYWSCAGQRGSNYYGKLYNCIRATNDTVTLAFLTPAGTTGVTYTLFWVAHYNSLIEFKQGGTEIVF